MHFTSAKRIVEEYCIKYFSKCISIFTFLTANSTTGKTGFVHFKYKTVNKSLCVDVDHIL